MLMSNRAKRQEGRRLNKQGRLSPLEVMQQRMEHFQQLAQEELAKGAEASKEKISAYLAAAQNAAEALAPYRHPRLQASAIETTVRRAVIRAPELCDTVEDWVQKYVPAEMRDQPPKTIDGEVVAREVVANPPDGFRFAR